MITPRKFRSLMYCVELDLMNTKNAERHFEYSAVMEALKAFTSGKSMLDDFARNTFLKNNLTNKLEDVIRDIQREFLWISETSDSESLQNLGLVVTDVTIKCIYEFLIIIEAIILHGLKEKLTFSKVLSPVRQLAQSNRFQLQNNKQIVSKNPDFWPVILILNHNQVNLSLKNLNNIDTDVGRCRAWIRFSLNDGLLSSYLRALVNDTSLLHGFYRPSAYLRDREQMDRFLNLIDSLDNIRFKLNYNYQSLNKWNNKSLILSGFNLDDSQIQDENALEPVFPVVDALNLVKNDDENVNKRDDKSEELDSNVSDKGEKDLLNTSRGSIVQIKTGWSTSPPPHFKTNISNDKFDQDELTPQSASMNHASKSEIKTISPSTTGSLANKLLTIGGKSSKTSIASSKSAVTKPIKIINKPQISHNFNSCNYDSLLQSYSDEANLCSTPEIRDICIAVSKPVEGKKFRDGKPKQDQSASEKMKSKPHNYEIIPESLVLDNSNESTRQFLSKFFDIQTEIGLDKQDYKCNHCARPIGMVYGKSRLCKYDALHYCLDCNQDDKAVIPARMIHNWDFNLYTISKENKDKLELVENEPLINIKLTNPLLYQYNTSMKIGLKLRTQLFYLHAYLFTCQESVALDLRKQVWPSEHLFEHIHLYSLNDLQQVQNGTLFVNLKKSISLAKKHVLVCLLCSQKGFICEICNNPKIIYPFDVDTTYRCDKCKTCFHMNCIIQNSSQLVNNNLNASSLNLNLNKPKHKPCPRCLRICTRDKIRKIRMT